MRIGLSTSVIQRGQTGIARYVLSLVRTFMKHVGRHEFTLFVLNDDLPLFDFAREAMHLVAVPERYRPPVRDILWHQLELPKLARQHQLDVLHVPSYRRLLWPQPCALVATIHDLAQFHIPKKYDRLRMFYGQAVVRHLARRQHQIIAVSQTTANDITTHFGVPSRQVTVIPNGVDHQRFFSSPRDAARILARQRHGLQQPFFLYVARLEHPAKNHVRLITAFDRFKARTHSPWQLVLAGGDWHGAESIHAAIQQANSSKDIIALGFVPEQELPDLIRAADVFVYPSLYEGFGMPPIEAMACGCPVICSNSGSLGEVVGAAAATVDPEDIASLERNLIRMALDEGIRMHWRTAGLQRARQFNWQYTARATLEIYQQAANNMATPQATTVMATHLN